MKKHILIVGIALLFAVSTASAGALWFNQDDFWNYYNASPGAPGNVAVSTGQILDFANTANILGSYAMTGISAGAVQVGTDWQTVYTGTLTLALTSGPVIGTWTGSGTFYTLAPYPDADVPAQGKYPTNVYTGPVGYPLGAAGFYKSIGAGSFTQTGGTLAYPDINLDWFGTYNWSYGSTPTYGPFEPSNFANYQFGNAQGSLSVPEPGLILLLGLGLAGVSAISFTRRLKK